MNHRRILVCLSATATFVWGGLPVAHARSVTIGVTISSTGPAASLGVAQKNTIELLPKVMGGYPVNYIVLDDATDPTQAAKNARRFVEADKVDAIVGATTTPTSLAVAEVANESRTPQLGLAPYAAKDVRWTFSLPQTYALMYSALFQEMKRRNTQSVGFIGFSDALGDAGLKEVEKFTTQHGIKLVVSERYARTDQSVTAQALRILQAKPDAVVFAASGTAAALPMRALRERGFKGPFYQNHGVANNDFLRVAGSTGEGMISPTGLVLVAEQLPGNNPSKKVGLAYLASYESKFGPGSRNPFGAYAHDAYLLLDNAVAAVGKSATPGTPEFRAALRDALERTRSLPLTHGLATVSASDHTSLGEAAVVLITIEQGSWKLVK